MGACHNSQNQQQIRSRMSEQLRTEEENKQQFEDFKKRLTMLEHDKFIGQQKLQQQNQQIEILETKVKAMEITIEDKNKQILDLNEKMNNAAHFNIQELMLSSCQQQSDRSNELVSFSSPRNKKWHGENEIKKQLHSKKNSIQVSSNYCQKCQLFLKKAIQFHYKNSSVLESNNQSMTEDGPCQFIFHDKLNKSSQTINNSSQSQNSQQNNNQILNNLNSQPNNEQSDNQIANQDQQTTGN